MQQMADWVLGMTCLHRGIAPVDDIPSVTTLHQDATIDSQVKIKMKIQQIANRVLGQDVDEEVYKSITNTKCPHNQQPDHIMK